MVIYPDLADGASPGTLLVINPGAGNLAAIFMEMICTFILVTVVFRTAAGVYEPHFNRDMDADQIKETKAKKRQVWMKKNFVPIAIGFTLGFLSFASSFVSGGAYNPARALGGCVVGTDCGKIWVYFIGDFVGGILAGLFHFWFIELPHEQAADEVADAYDADVDGF